MVNLTARMLQAGLKQSPLVEQIYNILSEAIVEGDLEGGQQLIEAKLQDQFGVSKSPIREAFRVLEKNGFVEIVPRRGTFVRKISEKDAKESFPIRARLEGLAAGLAAVRLSAGDIRKMEKALASMEKASLKPDHQKYLRHHVEFHNIFIEASGNDSLIDILMRLRRQNLWFISSFYHFRTAILSTLEVHREILNCFVAKDAAGAEHLVQKHILAALDKFASHLQTKTG